MALQNGDFFYGHRSMSSQISFRITSMYQITVSPYLILSMIYTSLLACSILCLTSNGPTMFAHTMNHGMSSRPMNLIYYQNLLIKSFIPPSRRMQPLIILVHLITHGLTVRLILCQLFKWSTSTFHSVYNANNSDIYVLKRDLTKKGRSPYVLIKMYPMIQVLNSTGSGDDTLEWRYSMYPNN